MLRLGFLALLGALLTVGVAHGQSDTAGRTTLEQRVVPADVPDPFKPLTLGPGDPLVVREDLAAGKPGREDRRRSIAYFGQLSDFQLADEESPTRVEAIDQSYPSLTSSAWRPQEALLAHITDASIRQVATHLKSPFRQAGGRRAGLGFTVLTGDNADNQQLNETRWVAALLDGGTVDPNSGKADAASMSGTGCALLPQAAAAAEAPRYTGVQDYDDYVEGAGFYDPDVPAGQYAAWPAYPGLMDAAQRPFQAAGLPVPSYVALGNHDSLVQGNQASTATLNGIATGCLKPLQAPTLNPSDPGALFSETLLTTSPQNSIVVPPDADRRQITKPEYRSLFQGRQMDAHGFAFIDADEAAASKNAASYYDFSPATGLRFVALDTVAEAGIAGITHQGNVDDPQLRWLERTLAEAEAADELVVLFSHHAPESLTAFLPDEIAGPCEDRENPQSNGNPGCDLDPRDSSPVHLGADMVEVVLRHPHVIAWVAGHSHVNDVAFEKRADGSGGFWIVRTSAEADFPHQDRLIDVMDNFDGTISLMSALIDNAAPSAAPAPGTPAEQMSVDQLASLGRTLGFNDPQAGATAAGDADDRNVELLVPDPRRNPPAAPAAKRRLRISVRPKRIRAGRRTVVKVRVRRAGKPVKRVKVRFAGRVKRTNARGRARFVVKPRRTGIRQVKVRKHRAPVTVVRR